MLTIQLLTIGHKPPSWIQAGITQYKQRLEGQFSMIYHALPAVSTKLDPKARAQKETTSLQAKILPGHHIIALDAQGKSISSAHMADSLYRYQQDAQPITFIIGPSDGLSPVIKQQAHTIWSLSAMTFTHDLAQLLLLEQLYRSHCIHTNHPYHRA